MTTPRIEEMKPCPFCGKSAQSRLSKKKYDQLHGDEYQNPVVGCFNSNCDFQPKIERGAETACVEAWNNQKAHQAGIDEAVEIVESLRLEKFEVHPQIQGFTNVGNYNQALDDTTKALQDNK